jgi:hypothetical protein
MFKSDKFKYVIFKCRKDGFKGERSGWTPQGLHKTEIKSGNVIETFVSLKS